MFQRLQSLYLIAAAGLQIALFALPFAKSGVDTAPMSVGALDFPVVILQVLTLACTLAALLSYKNRPRQLRLCILNGLVLAAYQVFAALAVWLAWRKADVAPDYSVSLVFPALAAILTFMAMGRIAKDERLVRSVDRLR